MKSEMDSVLQPAEHLNGALPQGNLSSNESGEYSGDPSLYVPISSQDKDLLENFGIEYSEGTAKYLNDLIEQDIPDMRLDYDPALRQHIVQTRRYFFDTLCIAEEAFTINETSHPLQRTLATLRYLNSQELDISKVVNSASQALGLNTESVQAKMDNLTELGLDAIKIVNATPPALGYNPDSIKAKMDNLTELGLDASKIVNTLPAALGSNPSKINLAAYSLMKAGLWEENPSFEGYKAKLNRGEATNILTIPIESLLAYLNDKENGQADMTKNLNSQVSNYMKQQGLATGPKRKEAMLAMLDQPDARKRLGYLAVVYALKEKLEVEF